MSGFCSRISILGTAALFWLVSFLLAPTVAGAQGQALQELLELLKSNGAISNEQAAKIKATLDKDRKAMADREKALNDREEALKQREEALMAREEALPPKPLTPPDAEQKKREAEAGTAGFQKEKAPTVAASEKKEFPLRAVFDDGFYLRSREKDLFQLRIGGLLQADYRYFNYHSTADPDKNKFDIRRARLLVAGKLYERFSYKFQYEFQGTTSRKLLDAYAGVRILPYLSLRVGQFKEPFSLEQQTAVKNIVFTERSMGWYLAPHRDVGFMAYSSFFKDRITYGLGIFNGDGVDDSTGGDCDSPEFTGRVVYAPFRHMGLPALNNLQFGGSFSYAKADRNNVKVTVRTSGLTTFFDVNSAAKFNIIRDVDSRTRYGAEMAWAYGPVLLWGEYINLRFSDVKTSDAEFDINLKDYYGAIMWMVTGEKPSLKKGVIQGIRPDRSLWGGGWGALGLAFRYDRFDGGDTAYEYLIDPGTSVREATSYTLGLNWYLNPYIRVLLDATRTNFDRPLLVEKDSLTGEAIYSDQEDVITGRVQLQF